MNKLKNLLLISVILISIQAIAQNTNLDKLEPFSKIILDDKIKQVTLSGDRGPAIRIKGVNSNQVSIEYQLRTITLKIDGNLPAQSEVVIYNSGLERVEGAADLQIEGAEVLKGGAGKFVVMAFYTSGEGMTRIRSRYGNRITGRNWAAEWNSSWSRDWAKDWSKEWAEENADKWEEWAEKWSKDWSGNYNFDYDYDFNYDYDFDFDFDYDFDFDFDLDLDIDIPDIDIDFDFDDDKWERDRKRDRDGKANRIIKTPKPIVATLIEDPKPTAKTIRRIN